MYIYILYIHTTKQIILRYTYLSTVVYPNAHASENQHTYTHYIHIGRLRRMSPPTCCIGSNSVLKQNFWTLLSHYRVTSLSTGTKGHTKRTPGMYIWCCTLIFSHMQVIITKWWLTGGGGRDGDLHRILVVVVVDENEGWVEWINWELWDGVASCGHITQKLRLNSQINPARDR